MKANDSMTKQVYIHFTDKEGAMGIAKSKELWSSSIIEGVYAVALGAAHVPEVQHTKLGRAKSRNYAVYFTTTDLPNYCYPEECVWLKEKIPVKIVKITAASNGIKDLDGSVKVLGTDFVQRLAVPTKEAPDPNNPPDWFFTELRFLVGQILKEEIEEAAKTPEELHGTRLAIFPEIGSERISLTLFDQAMLDNYVFYKNAYLRSLDAFEEERKKSGKNLKLPTQITDRAEQVREIESQIIVGMIRAVKTQEKTPDGDSVWRISEVAAEKGYGPLLYEAVMYEIGEDWLAPDNRSVSDSAKRIWNKFFNRPDVEKLMAPQGATRHFPEDVSLNSYYRPFSSGAARKYRKLYNPNPHKGIKPNNFFRRLGVEYFGNKYRDEISG